MFELDAEEARVVGSLAEKQLATPQYYPLTLNALVNACNQSNNRDPVVSYDASTVEGTLGRLRHKGVARVIHAGGGNRTAKYRHVLDEILGLDGRELALLTVMLLRGPQTLAELRARTERMADFEDAADIERDLTRLAQREEPLVVRLERQPGHKEPRYATLLTPLAISPQAARPPEPRPRPAGPRLRPLDELEWPHELSDLVDGIEDPTRQPMHLLRTLARHPQLFGHWLPFGRALLAGELPARSRELAILRTAWNTGSHYEWAHHAGPAREAGLTDDEVERVQAGPDAGWSALDASVLRAADELHGEASLSDRTWAGLAAALDERQLIELIFLVGHYHLVAFAINSLGIQAEDGVPVAAGPDEPDEPNAHGGDR